MSFKVMSVLGASSVASIYAYANTYPESFSKLTKTIQDTVSRTIQSENFNMTSECASISPVRKDWLNRKVTLVGSIGNNRIAWAGVIRTNGFYEGSFLTIFKDHIIENYYSNGWLKNTYRVYHLDKGVFEDHIQTDDTKKMIEHICDIIFAKGHINQFKQTEQFLEPSEVISICSKNTGLIFSEEYKKKD